MFRFKAIVALNHAPSSTRGKTTTMTMNDSFSAVAGAEYAPDIGKAPAADGFIRRVLRTETFLIKEHLLRLDAEARHRRFNHDVSDDFIVRYADHAADIGNLTFGYFVDGEIKAIAELRRDGVAGDLTGEVAFSVETPFANRGIATRLMGHVIQAARNRGLRHLILICLAENRKMQAIARHYGAELHIEEGSVVADIVPKSADCISLAAEMVENRIAMVHAVLDVQTRLARLDMSKS